MEEEKTHNHGPHGGAHTHAKEHTSVAKAAPVEESITIKKDTLWKGATFVFAALFFISLMTGGFGIGGVDGNAVNVPTENNVPTAPTPTPAPTPAAVKVSLDDDAVKGEEDAPVTIVEFSDYECPYCGRFYSQTRDQIISEYVDTGKVKMVFRDFPLSFHQNAQKAAEAAECAGEQGKYWEMHDALYSNQQSLDVASIKGYAADLGLNTGDFESCLDNGDMAAEVQKDFTEGQGYGVRGTPAFFINGKLVSGAQPFSVFQQAIDAELA